MLLVPRGAAHSEDRVSIVVGDVADAGFVDSLVERTDTVDHFAAESHDDNPPRAISDSSLGNLTG